MYNVLPPPPELDEVLAILFTGPCKLLEEDFKKTKMLLVSHKRVYKALNWLKLNHPAYHDLTISMENLIKYPENMPPVSNKAENGARITTNSDAYDVAISYLTCRHHSYDTTIKRS